MSAYYYNLQFLPRVFTCLDSKAPEGVLRLRWTCVQVGDSQDMNTLADELCAIDRELLARKDSPHA
jgi:hypothetical protein